MTTTQQDQLCPTCGRPENLHWFEGPNDYGIPNVSCVLIGDLDTGFIAEGQGRRVSDLLARNYEAEKGGFVLVSSQHLEAAIAVTQTVQTENGDLMRRIPQLEADRHGFEAGMIEAHDTLDLIRPERDRLLKELEAHRAHVCPTVPSPVPVTAPIAPLINEEEHGLLQAGMDEMRQAATAAAEAQHCHMCKRPVEFEVTIKSSRGTFQVLACDNDKHLKSANEFAKQKAKGARQ